MNAFTHECCYMCHGYGTIARDMFGPGSTVIESDVACPYCNGKGTVVVEHPSQPTPAQLPQGRADEPAARIQEQRSAEESDAALINFAVVEKYRARIADLEAALASLIDNADGARIVLKGSK